MKAFLTIFLLCFSFSLSAADAMRIRAERIEQETVFTQHGTAFTLEDFVFTAYHVVDSKTSSIFIERKEGWIRCEVIYQDEKLDIAIIKPDLKTTPFIELDAKETGCIASIQGTPLKKLKYEFRNDKLYIEGYDVGGSGAPVFKDGEVLGMAVAYHPEDRAIKMVSVKRLLTAIREFKAGQKSAD